MYRAPPGPPQTGMPVQAPQQNPYQMNQTNQVPPQNSYQMNQVNHVPPQNSYQMNRLNRVQAPAQQNPYQMNQVNRVQVPPQNPYQMNQVNQGRAPPQNPYQMNQVNRVQAPPQNPYPMNQVNDLVQAPQQKPCQKNQTNRPLTKWSSGLFDCTDDVGNCITTCLCPCVTFGQIANIVDQGMCPCGCLVTGSIHALLCCMCMCCMCSCFYRSKLRSQYILDDGLLPDCLVHLCCEYCALCQEYRELKHQGFDMGISWEANMERMKRRNATGDGTPVMQVPAMYGGMMR